MGLRETAAIYSCEQYIVQLKAGFRQHQDIVIRPEPMFCTCVQNYPCMHVCLRTCMCESDAEVVAFVTT